MAAYIFQNPDTGETKEIFQGMNENHSYQEGDVLWKRVFVSPQARASSFSNIDPNSYSQFNQWLDKGKGGTMGDLWDASKELSSKREEKYGSDPLKEKSLADYSKVRKGLKHPSQK